MLCDDRRYLILSEIKTPNIRRFCSWNPTSETPWFITLPTSMLWIRLHHNIPVGLLEASMLDTITTTSSCLNLTWYYIVPASSVATGSLRWTEFSGCRMTGWQPASLLATQLPCYCRCWPLTSKVRSPICTSRLRRFWLFVGRSADVAIISLVFGSFICNPGFV